MILATRDSIPGTGNNYYEAYWWFDRDGLVRINADEAVATALKDILPAGLGVWKGGGLNLRDLTFESSVWKEGDANCCPTGGEVELKFRLDQGSLAVTDERFSPK